MSNKKKEKGRMAEFKRKEEGRVSLLQSIAAQCLLDCGSGVGKVFKGGKEEWEWDGGVLMRRIRDGVARFPFVGLDSEGDGAIYVQVGWVGESVLEAAVFGPRFFPEEVADLLRDPAIYIAGRDVHDDIMKVLGRKTGMRGIDLSVPALDLPDAWTESMPMRTNLGALAFEATGVSFEHIKSARKKPQWRKFIGIREAGWNRADIGLEKTVYAALDSTMPFPVVFNYLVHWLNVYRTAGRKDAGMLTWQVMLGKALGPLVDREICQRSMAKDRLTCSRDLMDHHAALKLTNAIL